MKEIQDLIDLSKYSSSNIPLIIEDAYKRGVREGKYEARVALFEFIKGEELK